MDGGVVHIAGFAPRVGCHVRQRCAWCGSVLIDENLHAIGVEVTRGTVPGTPPTWGIGVLVRVDGDVHSLVEHEDGAQLPPESCASLDPAVTA